MDCGDIPIVDLISVAVAVVAVVVVGVWLALPSLFFDERRRIEWKIALEYPISIDTDSFLCLQYYYRNRIENIDQYTKEDII